jgi:hypothetical protein
VREIVWTGSGAQGRIPPGQFLNFPIATEIPGKAGEELTFKVLQYYDNGKVVRWIGGPGSDEPAPQIDVTAEGGVLQDVAGSETAPPKPAAEATAGEVAGSSSGSGDSASKGLGIAALIAGALGLLAGGGRVGPLAPVRLEGTVAGGAGPPATGLDGDRHSLPLFAPLRDGRRIVRAALAVGKRQAADLLDHAAELLAQRTDVVGDAVALADLAHLG